MQKKEKKTRAQSHIKAIKIRLLLINNLYINYLITLLVIILCGYWYDFTEISGVSHFLVYVTNKFLI